MGIYRMSRYMNEEGKRIIEWAPIPIPDGLPIGESGSRFLGEGEFAQRDRLGKPVGHSRELQFPIDAKTLDEAFAKFDESSDAHCDLLAKQMQEHAEKQRRLVIPTGHLAKELAFDKRASIPTDIRINP